MQVSPSILNSDFLQLGKTIEMLNQSDADYIHLDVMDGVFVPNISIGQSVVASISKVSTKPLDVHLMIVDPDRYIDSFAEAGANILTVQYEACTHLHRTVQRIKAKGMMAGVAINPHTPISILEEIIQHIDLVLVMTVNPGFGGQSFIETSYEKIKKLKSLIIKSNAKVLIELDGGINSKNAAACKAAGADIIVAGNAVFASKNPLEEITQLRNI